MKDNFLYVSITEHLQTDFNSYKLLYIIKSRSHFRVRLITICAVVKSKCAVEKDDVCTKNVEILVKMMIYALMITRLCTVANPASDMP